MTGGVHLPQAGPAASGDALTRTALLAEELGFSDVWVSDHLVVPADVPYPPSAYVLEPLAVMSWVAAATSRVRIGTTRWSLTQTSENPSSSASRAVRVSASPEAAGPACGRCTPPVIDADAVIDGTVPGESSRIGSGRAGCEARVISRRCD